MKSNWKVYVSCFLLMVLLLTSCGAGKTPGSNSAPTSTQPPMSTNTPEPTFTPTETIVPTPTMDADPLVYDNFNNPDSDRKYNKNLWYAEIEAPSQAYQKDGVLNIHNELTDGGTVEVIMAPYYKVKLTEPIFIEADILYSPDSTSDGNVSLTIRDDQWDWQSSCVLNSTGETFCWETVFPQVDGHSFSTPIIPAKKNQWHKLKIEIDPGSMTFTYYLDGNKIGQNTSVDAEMLQNTTLTFTFAVWKPAPGFLNGQIENVRIGPLGN